MTTLYARLDEAVRTIAALQGGGGGGALGAVSGGDDSRAPLVPPTVLEQSMAHISAARGVLLAGGGAGPAPHSPQPHAARGDAAEALASGLGGVGAALEALREGSSAGEGGSQAGALFSQLVASVQGLLARGVGGGEGEAALLQQSAAPSAQGAPAHVLGAGFAGGGGAQRASPPAQQSPQEVALELAALRGAVGAIRRLHSAAGEGRR
jgi:hypothetical protein